MKYEIISEKDAPKPRAKVSNGATEAVAIVAQLKKGSVAKIEPDERQTIRGMRVNLSKAAKVAGVKLQTWNVESVLYVKLV